MIQQGLPIAGLYIQGSIALDAFNERFSDIDFVAVLSRPCTEAEVQQLGQIHRQIAERYPRWQMQGDYLQGGDLGKVGEGVPPHPVYSDGKLNPADNHGSDLVTWWILKNRGLTILGPDAATLPFSVDWDLLISQMHQNMNTYWASFTKAPNRFIWMLTDNGFQWAVLGVLRQYYTFEEQAITSKTGAGQYGLTHLPAEWHRIIEEAVNLREQRTASLYRSKIGRAIDAVKFLRYVIALCNNQRG